jgi:hypothetical protein
VGDRGGRLLNGEGGRFGLGAFVGCFVGLFWAALAIVGPLFSLVFWDFSLY